MGAGFFDTFFDSEYRQRADLHELQDRGTAIASDLQTHTMQIRGLQTQVNDLSMIVGLLIKVLDEGGQVDAKVLRYRIEAEVDARQQQQAASQRARDTGPSPLAEPPPTTPTTCMACGRVVPANRTVITANGTICDQCSA